MRLVSQDRARLDFELEATALRYDQSGMAREVGRGEEHLKALNRTWAKATRDGWLVFRLEGDDLVLALGEAFIDGPRLVKVRACPDDWGRGNGEAVMQVVCAEGEVSLTPLGWAFDRNTWGEEIVIARRSFLCPRPPGPLRRPSALAA